MKIVINDAATIYRGDCLDILPTLSPGSVSMCLTDPPYGYSNMDGDLNSTLHPERAKHGAILNDSQEEMRLVVGGMLGRTLPLMREEAACCVFCGGGCGIHRQQHSFAWLAMRMNVRGWRFAHAVIWDKKTLGLGWRFRRCYEFVMVAFPANGKLSWRDKKSTSPNILAFPKPRDMHHPNEKPVELCARLIDLMTKPADLVIDPFMGSGTTGVACMRTGRRFVGIELDQRHFEVARKRIEDASLQPELPGINLKRMKAPRLDLD